MARPLRIEYPGALYHVTSRGNALGKIFKHDSDKHSFLKILEFVVKRFNWLCHAYCLMDNHYHLVIETPEANLARGMRQLNGIYTQKFNWIYTKTGHIFQGRYKAILVDKDSYLLELCRYVVLNPVRSQMLEKPEDWRWSSFLYTTGLRAAPAYLTTDWVLSQFGGDKRSAQIRYRKFVREGINQNAIWEDLKGQIFLGDKGFIEKSFGLNQNDKLSEIPRTQKYASRPILSDLFPEGRKMTKKERDVAMHRAHVSFGYTLKEISDYLGIHYTTVSKGIHRIEPEN